MVLSSKRRLCEKKKSLESKKFDFVTDLFSKELALKVFSFLSLQDLVQCAVVSMHWSMIANDEMVTTLFNRFRSILIILFVAMETFIYEPISTETRCL